MFFAIIYFIIFVRDELKKFFEIIRNVSNLKSFTFFCNGENLRNQNFTRKKFSDEQFYSKTF